MYTTREQNNIETEIEHYKHSKTERDEYMSVKLFTGLILLSATMIPGLYSDMFCPSCGEHLNIEVSVKGTKGYFFPDTWKCSNCGQENYEGIRSCAYCGGK